MEMDSYAHVVPAAEPVKTVVLGKKTGKVPKGSYGFLEYYCIDPACDCRRVNLVVANEKMKQKAAISFGFDQEGPFGGPYLLPSQKQSPYAQDLLQIFADALNASPEWLERLYRHYAAVREEIEGKPYGGKPFPEPGKLVYHATPPPDLAAEIEQSLKNLQGGGRAPAPGRGKRVAPARGGRAGEAPSREKEDTISSLVARYADATFGAIDELLQIQGDLRRYLLSHDQAGEEIASLLPGLYQQSPQPDEQIQGALRLLFDSLDLLRQETEGGSADAKRRMASLQKALAQHIFTENEDPDLCAAAANIIIQSRVEILPDLRESATNMVVACAPRSDLHDVPAEDLLAGIARSFHSMGVASPFEGVQELQQLLVMNDPEVQVALTADMLQSEEKLLREIASLMIFDHERDVRLGVAQSLASIDGALLTPETLLRLIVSRNWFSPEIRKHVDEAITNARRARIECAPLPKLPAATIYASAIDGEGRQSFEVIVPDGSGFARCSLVMWQGEGVQSCFAVPLNSKYEQENASKALNRDPAFLESSAELLDLRVCNSLADGSRAGTVPNHWLVRVAELLGRDRWRPISFDAARELLSLQEELASHDPKLLDEREYRDAVALSGELYDTTTFMASWYEMGEDVDREIEAARGKGKAIDNAAATDRVVDAILEKRRAVWLERLVVTALWLKTSSKPPVKWHRVYHVAQALADESVPLKDVPLMVSIAKGTLKAYNQRGRRKGA